MQSTYIALVLFCLTVVSSIQGSILGKVEWKPVFRVNSGSGHNVYDLWSGETTLNVTEAYKAELVNTWQGVKKVKLAMLSEGEEVMSLVFDGRHTDRMSWFVPGRLISSFPYVDMKTEHMDYFSINGVYVPGETDRRFYINRNSGSCYDNKGWIVVVDSETPPDVGCDYEQGPAPSFLYSQWQGYARARHFSHAEALVISVEADDDSAWDMVFRSTPGVDANIFHLWTSNETKNIDDVELRSTSADVAGIFKSDRVNSWSQVNQVKVAMYRNGVEEMYLIFDARDSDRLSWFSAERLTSASYSDIMDYGHNYFSIPGHIVNHGIKRRFYVMKNYGSFCVDYGWMVVLDQDSGRGCDWDVQGPNPSFMYSPSRTFGLGAGFSRADVFAIYFNKETKPLENFVPPVNYLDFESFWTRERTGCQCYFDPERFDCACCIDGGCQCTIEHQHQCVQCGYNERCGRAEAVPGAWTGNMTCVCRNDPSDRTCACCYNDGCQCAGNGHSCTQCGREDLC